MRTISRNIVSAIIFSKDGKILFGKKDPKQGGVYTDVWHIPGGGIEEGEEMLIALKREVMEEMGIDIAPYNIVLVDDQGTGTAEKTLKDTGEKVLCNMQFNVYKVIIQDKNANEVAVKLSDDLVEYRWFSPEELSILSLVPAAVVLFERLGMIKK